MKDEKSVILVVDDTVENLNILVKLLDEYDVRDVTDAIAALKILEQENIDLILLDVVMPSIDGFELCNRIMRNSRTAEIPIIFITAMADEDSIERAYEIGGKDYVTKPFKPRELRSRVKTQLELRRVINHLQFLVFHDPMTGICNRRKFFELSTDMFSKYDDIYAIMLDIDHFKKINDMRGHAAGDEVIKQVVNTIKGLIPHKAVFGRLGGEEFAIVGAQKDAESIYRMVELLRLAVQNLSFCHDDRYFSCTISCGIALKDYSRRSFSFEELLHAADEALYDAKGGGRNRITFKFRNILR